MQCVGTWPAADRVPYESGASGQTWQLQAAVKPVMSTLPGAGQNGLAGHSVCLMGMLVATLAGSQSQTLWEQLTGCVGCACYRHHGHWHTASLSVFKHARIRHNAAGSAQQYVPT